MTEVQKDALRLAIETCQALGKAMVVSIEAADQVDPESERVSMPRFGVETAANYCVSLKGFLEDFLGDDE